MDDTRWERWGAATGFAILAFMGVGFFLAPLAPAAGDPLSKIAGYFSDNRSGILAQNLLFLAGTGFLFWFLGSLRSFILRHEGGTGRYATILYGAGVAGATIGIVGQIFPVTLALASSETVQPTLVRTLFDLGNTGYLISSMPFAVMGIAFALASLRKEAFPRWIGWVGALTAAMFLVSTAGIVTRSGPLAAGGSLSYAFFPVFGVWLVATTVVMIKRIGQPVTRVPDTAQEVIEQARIEG